MFRYIGMCYGNEFVFHKESLDMGPNFVKNFLEVGPISRKLQKKKERKKKVDQPRTKFAKNLIKNKQQTNKQKTSKISRVF